MVSGIFPPPIAWLVRLGQEGTCVQQLAPYLHALSDRQAIDKSSPFGLSAYALFSTTPISAATSSTEIGATLSMKPNARLPGSRV